MMAKKGIEIQPGLMNLGPLNSGQMLLPMSYENSGIGAEDRWHLSIDAVRFSVLRYLSCGVPQA